MKRLTDFQLFLFITLCGFLLFLFISLPSFGRVRTGLPVNHSGYVSISPGYIPMQSNTGALTCNLNVGYCRAWFVEYSQIIGLSSSVYAPKMFCLRSGYSFSFSGLELRPFVGIGVMPVTDIEDDRKAKPCFTTGAYLLQDIGKDFQIKYELSISNKYVIPSIGIYCTF